VTPEAFKEKIVGEGLYMEHEDEVEEALSVESYLLHCLVVCHEVWLKEHNEEEQFLTLLSLNELTRIANLKASELLDHKTVASIYGKLGFKKCRQKSVTWIIWNANLVERLQQRYPIDREEVKAHVDRYQAEQERLKLIEEKLT
jgi:hypothetical protein